MIRPSALARISVANRRTSALWFSRIPTSLRCKGQLTTRFIRILHLISGTTDSRALSPQRMASPTHPARRTDQVRAIWAYTEKRTKGELMIGRNGLERRDLEASFLPSQLEAEDRSNGLPTILSVQAVQGESTQSVLSHLRVRPHVSYGDP